MFYAPSADTTMPLIILLSYIVSLFLPREPCETPATARGREREWFKWIFFFSFISHNVHYWSETRPRDFSRVSNRQMHFGGIYLWEHVDFSSNAVLGCRKLYPSGYDRLRGLSPPPGTTNVYRFQESPEMFTVNSGVLRRNLRIEGNRRYRSLTIMEITIKLEQLRKIRIRAVLIHLLRLSGKKKKIQFSYKW